MTTTKLQIVQTCEDCHLQYITGIIVYYVIHEGHYFPGTYDEPEDYEPNQAEVTLVTWRGVDITEHLTAEEIAELEEQICPTSNQSPLDFDEPDSVAPE